MPELKQILSILKNMDIQDRIELLNVLNEYRKEQEDENPRAISYEPRIKS